MTKGKHRYLLIAGMISCCFFTAAAQDTSLNVLSQQHRQQYDFFAKDVISQPLLRLSNYALLQAGYSVKSGGYRLAQEAEKERDIHFFTEGTKRLGKYLVSGVFSYQHSAQDSVAYTLRNMPEETSPYYFYAGKNGNWEKGSYHLQGIVSRALNNEKFVVGAGVVYNANNAWRSNDPRPEYFSHAMKGSVSLQYSITPQHKVAIEGTFHGKSSETSVEYRNQDYSLSLLYAEYVNYMQYGYGFGAVQTTGRQIRSNSNGLGWKGLYHGDFSFGSITVKGGYTAVDNHYKRAAVGTEAEVKYGSYYEDIKDASLLWQLKKNELLFSMQATYINHLGRDFNTLLNANNYVYSFEQFKIAPLVGKYKQQELKYELGIEAAMTDLFKADGASSVTTDYLMANVAAVGNWYKRISPTKLLKAGLKAGLTVSVSSQVTQPIQQSNFIKAVVFRDAYYYRANSFTTDAEILYNFDVKKMHPYVKLQGQCIQATLNSSEIPDDFLPGKERWKIQCSIGITL